MRGMGKLTERLRKGRSLKRFLWMNYDEIGVIASPICISTVKIADHYIRKKPYYQDSYSPTSAVWVCLSFLEISLVVLHCCIMVNYFFIKTIQVPLYKLGHWFEMCPFNLQWKHVTVSSFINILYAMSSWLIIIDVGLFSKSSGLTKICLLKLIICVKPSILNPALSLIIGDTKVKPA
ncbi:hypothetical protein AGLY_017956 [Aphis glycines]|uniref:Uncharacterized protein n=1 Tax=Aphis glycines TaxID=307491 RepID=A0A6G0STD8_APHGL|nr:hypothetical protein AGLY_017956 [Aphis glycines]